MVLRVFTRYLLILLMKITLHNMKKILLIIDFSKNNNALIKIAGNLAEKHAAEIILLNVINLPNSIFRKSFFSIFLFQQEISLEENFIKLNLLKKQFVSEFQIHVSTEIETGNKLKIVTDMQQNYQVDLVIMGITSKTHMLSRDFLADKKIISSVPCPVLTVPYGFQKSEFYNLLYPVRQVLGALYKYDYAKLFFLDKKAKIHFLGLENQEKENFHTSLNTNLLHLQIEAKKDQFLHPTYSYEKTINPSVNILQHINVMKSDLAVINTIKNNNSKDAANNSFVENLLLKAQIPLLFVNSHTIKKHLGTERYLSKLAHF